MSGGLPGFWLSGVVGGIAVNESGDPGGFPGSQSHWLQSRKPLSPFHTYCWDPAICPTGRKPLPLSASPSYPDGPT